MGRDERGWNGTKGDGRGPIRWYSIPFILPEVQVGR